MLELKFGKKKEIVRGKKLSQPGVFPVRLQVDEMSWKLCLDYDTVKDIFVLSINDQAFLLLPYQAELIPTGS